MSKCRLQNIAIVAIVWHSCRVTLKTRWGPGGGTPLQEPNGDVPLDGVAFSRLE